MRELTNKYILKLKTVGRDTWAYILFFIIMIVKSGYYLFSYNPILDDFIQYGVYRLYQNPFSDILVKSGFLSARPLSGIFDIYVWSNFYFNLGIAFFIITVLFSVSGILIFKLFKRHFDVSFVFLLCYGLLPLSSEGANWLSASTRLVVPVFFMSVGLVLLQKFFDDKKLYFCILALFFILLSFAFYEQIIILSFIMTVTLIFLNKKPKLYYLLSLIPVALIAIPYCLIPSNSLYGQRISVISFGTDLPQHLQGVLTSIFDAILVLGDDIVNNGLRRGLEIIKADQNYVYLVILILCLSAVYWLSYHRNKQEDREKSERPSPWLLLYAIFLTVAPMALFLIIKNPWISLRNVFPSIIGLSLFIDLIFRYVAKVNQVRSVLAAFLCFVCLMVNIAELHDYRLAGQIDQKIAQNTVRYINEHHITTPMTIIGTKETYINAATPYHEHITNITSSDWAYKGALTATAKSLSMPNIYPIAKGNISKLYPYIDEITNFYALDENYNIVPLTYSKYHDNYSVYKNGTLYAEILLYDKNQPVLALIDNTKKAGT